MTNNFILLPQPRKIIFSGACRAKDAPLQATFDEVNEIMSRMDSADMRCDDAELVNYYGW